MRREHTALLSSLTALSAAIILSCSCHERDTGPNIILISLDTLRADALSAFGYKRDTSPNIDRFFLESVVFTRAYAPEPHTLPSHVSLFTSLHPLSHGVEATLSGGYALPEHLPTLSSILEQHGFATAAFINGGFLHPRFGVARGFQLYDYFSDIKGSEGNESSRHGRSAAETNAAVFRWLDEHQQVPFFLFVHYFDIHSDWDLLPYDAPEAYRRMFLKGEAAEASWKEPEQATEYLSAVNRGQLIMTPEILERVRALYDAGLRYTDDRLGELFEGLKERGLYDKAVIVLVSDHGEEFYEHGKTQHTQLYEECLHVPIAFHFPASAEVLHGARKDLVQIVDVTPTILDYLGMELPATMQGRSLLPTIREQQPCEGEPLVFCSSRTRELGIRNNDWKMIYDPAHNTIKLYDLERDPLERTNRASLEPARVEAAMAQLRYWRDTLPMPGMNGMQEEVHLDPETSKQLQSLGYLQ